jgi:hypothetical protein
MRGVEPCLRGFGPSALRLCCALTRSMVCTDALACGVRLPVRGSWAKG